MPLSVDLYMPPRVHPPHPVFHRCAQVSTCVHDSERAAIRLSTHHRACVRPQSALDAPQTPAPLNADIRRACSPYPGSAPPLTQTAALEHATSPPVYLAELIILSTPRAPSSSDPASYATTTAA
ncbi:hypothetical protein C8R44DRAFT_875440 [Mycena epipterygia]|nr:hypothetical protein C8R44DRAFT_875440 [Mycena epipterygia]